MSTAKRMKTALLAALAVMLVAAVPALAQFGVAAADSAPTTGDPGQLGDPASWRTPEFLRDNGMISIGAEFAYAAGYAGTGMNIGIVDSGFFAGHMREHGSLATNYAIGDRYHLGGSPGRRDGPDAAGSTTRRSTTATARTSAEPSARAATASARRSPPAPSPTCTASRSTPTCIVGNTAQDRRRALRAPAGDRDGRADARQRLSGERLQGRERGGAPRTGKPIRIITSSWGSQPNTENYNTLRHAARRPGELRLERGVAPPVHAGRRRRRERQHHPLAERRDRSRAHRHDHPVHRRQQRLRQPDAARRRTVLPARPGGPLVHDVGHQPRDRAHVQRRRLGPRPGAADVQPVRRREVVVLDRAGQRRSTARPCRSSTACRSRATAARRARRWPARTRRPRSR